MRCTCFRCVVLSHPDPSDASVPRRSSVSSVDSTHTKPPPGEQGGGEGGEGGEGDEESVFDEEGLLFGDSELLLCYSKNV